jgi:hypothetical protein
MRRLCLIVLLAFLAVGANQSIASAQVDPWEFEVYPYATEGPGIFEIETDNAVVADGHEHPGAGTASGEFRSQGTWYNQYEFTYGLTDRIEAAAYLQMAQVAGHGYWYAGSKYRLRGRLFDEDVLPVDLGWYFELEWHKTPQFDDDSLELEFRPILEKDFGRFTLTVNPKFEKVLLGPDHNHGVEFGYANGIYYRWMRYLSPGVEFFGGSGLLDDSDPLRMQQHYIVPVLWGRLPNGIGYSIGPGFGVTRGSDRVLVKFNLEFERYIGMLLHTSSEEHWFY